MGTSKPGTATAAMSKLSLDPPTQRSNQAAARKIKQPVADSWEDSASSSDEDNEGGGGDGSLPSTPHRVGPESGFAAPPPTPSSPTYSSGAPWQSLGAAADASSSSQLAAADAGPAKRPEKTDAVARRMIASALGVKAPKATDEQKAYERALREKERKRREVEREEERKRKEEAEKAKAAIWED